MNIYIMCLHEYSYMLMDCVCVLTEKRDVVNTVLYLLSDSAAMVNGAILPVDGGFLVT